MRKLGTLGLLNAALGLILVGLLVASLLRPIPPAAGAPASTFSPPRVVTPAESTRAARKAARLAVSTARSPREDGQTGPRVLAADDGQPFKD